MLAAQTVSQAYWVHTARQTAPWPRWLRACLPQGRSEALPLHTTIPPARHDAAWSWHSGRHSLRNLSVPQACGLDLVPPLHSGVHHEAHFTGTLSTDNPRSILTLSDRD